MDWLEALLSGLVQGITEFLPVSSDGHLTLVHHLFHALQGRTASGGKQLFFDVMLHFGTLAAIVVSYRGSVMAGARGLLGSEAVPPEYRRSAVVRVGLLAVVATLPLIPYVKLKHLIEWADEVLWVTGAGFLVTAAVLIITIRLPGGTKGPRETRWWDALLVGIAQAFAPLPGVSRSGLTIATALALGFDRPWAVAFSLLIAVPAILGANLLEILDVNPATLSGDRVAQTLAAAVLAGLVGYAAIVWLVRIVRAGRLWYFSVYLAVLGTVVLAVGLTAGSRSSRGGERDVRNPTAVDRTVRGSGARPRPGGGPDRAVGPVAGPVPAGARAGHAPPGAAAAVDLRAAGLVLGRPLARGAAGGPEGPLAALGGRGPRGLD